MTIFTNEKIKNEMTPNEIWFWLWFIAEDRGITVEALIEQYKKRD